MWWKLTLATVVGIVIGVAGTYGLVYLYFDAKQEIREGYLPKQWSSAGRDWPEFANWLRYGGRLLVTDAAFSAAKNGMTEAQVRSSFGPPDLVLVGEEELRSYPLVAFRGAGGAYLYKIGKFADMSDSASYGGFAIIFDTSGKVIYRVGQGERDGGKLGDIDVDTRTERRISSGQ